MGRRSARSSVHWARGRGSYAEAVLETGAKICEALAYAHRQGICHCDVKPSNVLLTAAGEALLLDFNLSMQQGGAAAVMARGTFVNIMPRGAAMEAWRTGLHVVRTMHTLRGDCLARGRGWRGEPLQLVA